MKTLQNNFTTPEQSKRLLELGVPVDSADMLWDGSIDANEGWVFEDFPIYSDKPFSYYQLLYRQEDVAHILPCWSVGRLMEILSICCKYSHCLPVDYCFIEYIVRVITNEIKLNRLDFSKLED